MRAALKKLAARLAPMVPDAWVESVLGQFCPIFMLHRVAESPRPHAQSAHHIEACLAYARRHGYRPIPLAELGANLLEGKPVPRRSVAFTIDDGFKDHYELAAPLFAKYDVPLTCFVITDFLDGRMWPWDDQLAYVLDRSPRTQLELELPDGTVRVLDLQVGRHRIATDLRDTLKALPQEGLYAWLADFYRVAEVDLPATPPADMSPMSWDEARTFAAMGHEIAPHTRSHRILAQLSDGASREEIHGSVQRVHDELGRRPRVFAYPTGRRQDYTSRESAYLLESGIVCAVSTVTQTAVPTDDVLALPRYALPNTLEDFAQYLGFVELAKQRLRSLRR